MNNKILIPLVATVALATGVGVSSWQQGNENVVSSSSVSSPIRIQGLVLDPARKIGIPELIKHDSSAFVLDDLKGHWSILFFGYTRCPDVCPTTMATLVAAKSQNDNFPQVILVSIDPQRDSVEILKEYVKYFDPEFIGITGAEKMIEALTLQTSVVYMKVAADSGNEDDYLMDHSASLLLINPEGKLQAFLKPPHSPQSIMESISKIKAAK